MNTDFKLYLVVPCFNEEEVIESSAAIINDKMHSLMEQGMIGRQSRVLLVDDGSKDSTWSRIEKICEENLLFCAIHFAKNEGHQNAVMAGMKEAAPYADAIISIDADLQQDIEALDAFIEKYNEGCDIVFGVRNSRGTDSFFKKMTATVFYKLMEMFGTKTIRNHADYRLVSKAALNCIREYSETQLFLRGLMADIGFKTDVIYFDVKERQAGASKYTLKKMINLAINGITSMSVKPLHLIVGVGGIALLASFIMLIIDFAVVVTGGQLTILNGILFSIWFVGGAILMALGVLGEYIGKIHIETKHRPIAYISKRINLEKKEND